MDQLITMGASTLMGFGLRFMAQWQSGAQDERKHLLDVSKQTNQNNNDASARAGVWMQRFAVFTLIGLFAYISVGVQQPTNIITDMPDTQILWGLISWGNLPSIVQVDGMLYTTTLQTSVLAILSYLFGDLTARR